MIFKMYINGAWREGSGGYKDVVSPINGEVLGQLCMGSAADVDAAVQGAVKQLEQLGHVRFIDGPGRKKYLQLTEQGRALTDRAIRPALEV